MLRNFMNYRELYNFQRVCDLYTPEQTEKRLSYMETPHRQAHALRTCILSVEVTRWDTMANYWRTTTTVYEFVTVQALVEFLTDYVRENAVLFGNRCLCYPTFMGDTLKNWMKDSQVRGYVDL